MATTDFYTQSDTREDTAKATWAKLDTRRMIFLQRARDCSKLTIPTLIPPQGHNDASKYHTTWQGVGARGVNNLASKLLLTLFPPNQPFFKLPIPPKERRLLEAESPDKLAAADAALSKVEQRINQEIETSTARVAVFECVKHLVVGGNGLLYWPEDSENLKFFPFERYVTQRDPMGRWTDIVVKEDFTIDTIPEDIREFIEKAGVGLSPEDRANSNGDGTARSISIYTHVQATPGAKKPRYTQYQEVHGVRIPDTDGAGPLEECPWIPLRMVHIDGDSYGRGYAEEYYGDLQSLEGLYQALVQHAAAAAKVVFLVKPTGFAKVERLAKAPNGGFAEGAEGDVTCLQVEKAHDFTAVDRTIQRIESRLESAFLLNSSVQRQAERVTAEEIRYVAGELDDALGGVYSLLSQELQLPLVRLLMARLARRGDIPKLPGKIKPQITTGFDALGRGNDLQKLDQFISGVGQASPQLAQALPQYVNFGAYLALRAAALGIDTEGLIKTDQEVQQAAQQQQQQAGMAGMAQAGIKAMGGPLAKGAADRLAVQQSAAKPAQP